MPSVSFVEPLFGIPPSRQQLAGLPVAVVNFFLIRDFGDSRAGCALLRHGLLPVPPLFSPIIIADTADTVI